MSHISQPINISRVLKQILFNFCFSILKANMHKCGKCTYNYFITYFIKYVLGSQKYCLHFLHCSTQM